MNPWLVLSSVFAIGVTVMATYKLVCHSDRFNRLERAGLGLMAGAGIMTIPPRMAEFPTPFDDWSGTILWFGIFLYLAGRLSRNIIHDRRNAAQLRSSTAWLRERGKLP